MYKVSVPGSLMLCGEHAVLHDKMAIVGAVDKRIKANLRLRDDEIINIISPIASLQTTTKSIEITEELRFVTTSIKHQIKNLSIKNGFDLNIESEFSAQIGLGSSAAVTVATLLLLELAYKNVQTNLIDLFLLSRKIIREVQGTGSGADVAASIFGGVILYKMCPLKIEKIADTLPLTVIYSGKKMPTTKVIAKVNASYGKYPNLFALLFDALELCSQDASIAIKEQNWQQLGELMNIHQGLQDALGVNDEALSQLIFALRKQSTIYGAKISGSGLGDCVIGVGEIAANIFSGQVEVKIGSAGIEFS